MTGKKAKRQGTFSQVSSILTSVQGNTVPDYQGLAAFWMDYDTLLSAKLYGNQLIAAAPDSKTGDDDGPQDSGSCCGSTSSDDPSANLVEDSSCWPSGGGRGGFGGAANTSRSERSGLIIGLRGQAPFDGTVFPPLLWEAKRDITESEIATIANWIDDGCQKDPDVTDKTTQLRAERSNLLALACGDSKHKTSDQCTNISQASQKGLKVRKEIGCLTDTEVQRLTDAIACMHTFDGHYQDERSFAFWGRMHANSCQHGWEQFLPWHRLYLYFFEQMLQDFDEHITIPYWAWSDYANENRDTFNTKQLDQGILPERFACWLDQRGYETLAAAANEKRITLSSTQLNKLAQMTKAAKVYQSSNRFLKAVGIPFMVEVNPETSQAQWTDTIRAIYLELLRINPFWTPKRWPGAQGNPTTYPTAEDIDRVLQTPNWNAFGGGPEHDHHFGTLEQVHNGMHNFSGGTNPNYPRSANPKWIKIYSDLGITPDPQNPDNPPNGLMVDARVTAFDPIFWAHHSNVDRIWAQWQENHSNGRPDDMDGVLAPWSLTVRDTMSTRKLGYEYMRSSHHYKTSSQYSMTKFNSQTANVDWQVLDTFKKAEVRLHRVQHANLPSSVLRIYLNDDSACHTTTMQDNQHFAAELHTFHGTCHGGPGHCNLPLDKTRHFDRRTLNHNEPRNYRIDVTDTVNRMLAKGEDDISVHIVVVGLDGQPLENALYLDGVSLNFMD
ncbi:MAG: tyrosinase family protein [Arenicella sp.]|nr:tyrosinase family protein [Arenicella sp.]